MDKDYKDGYIDALYDATALISRYMIRNGESADLYKVREQLRAIAENITKEEIEQ